MILTRDMDAKAEKEKAAIKSLQQEMGHGRTLIFAFNRCNCGPFCMSQARVMTNVPVGSLPQAIQSLREIADDMEKIYKAAQN